MSFGKRLLEIRKSKGLSQEDIAKHLNTKAPVVGRYERDEMKPSIDTANNIATFLEVSLDFLVGNSSTLFDAKTIQRMQDIENLPTDDKKQVFLLIDALLRDFKAKQAYS